MDREKLEATAARFPYLQGLLYVPIGVWFIITGLTQLGSPETAWITLVAAALAVAGYFVIARYYKATYGKVTPPKSRQVRDLVATFGGVVLIIVGASLDNILDLPISGYAAAFALVMLLYTKHTVGLSIHHIVIWGGLCVAALLPIWSADDIPVALLAMGAATMVAGIFDHLLLVRTYGSPKGLDLENTNAGA
jgi:hypothetical protein